MKRSLIIQIFVLIFLIAITNLVRDDNHRVQGFTNIRTDAEIGAITVDFDGQEKIFTTSPDETPPKFGEQMVMAISGEPESLNPYTSTSASARRILEYIYEGLVDYDYRTWVYNRPVLADSFAISEDNMTFTFYLRQNARWHDGRPLTAEDCLMSLKAIMNPFVDDASLRSYYTAVTDAYTEGPYQFVVKTSDTYFQNLEFVGGFNVLPKHIWDPDGLMDRFTIADLQNPAMVNDEPDIKTFADRFNTHPLNRPAGQDALPIIGSGPFKFNKWITGDYVSLIRNKDYWNDGETFIPGFCEKGAYLDEVVIKFISDWTAKLTALKSGEIDFAPRLRPIQYFEQTVTDDFLERFQKVSYVSTAYGYIGWNNRKPWFRDKRVRQAMTLMVDRDSFNKYINYNLNIPTIGPFYLYSDQYNNNIEPWPYDPIRAVELIEAAGWIDHDGDGIRDKDGIPFEFAFSVSSGSKLSRLLALILKEDLRKIGIVMSIRSLEWSVYVENLRDSQFDVVQLLSIGGLQSDPYQTWHSDNVGNRGSNYSGFSNPEADSLIWAARYEPDKERRNAMYYRLQEILHEEQPYTFMYSQRYTAAYNKEFNGVTWIPNPPGYKIYSWWSSQGEAAAPAF